MRDSSRTSRKSNEETVQDCDRLDELTLCKAWQIALRVIALAGLMALIVCISLSVQASGHARGHHSAAQGLTTEIPTLRSRPSGTLGPQAIASCEPLPAWPTGEKIAFVSDRDGMQQIYLMNPDGSDQVRLCTLGDAHSPRWSPDGTRVVFECRFHVCWMYADGSYQRDIGPGMMPDWSPDGRQIVFRGGPPPLDCMARHPVDDWGIYVMDIDGSNVSGLTDGEMDDVPRWSPDGGKIAFNRPPPEQNREIFVMDADGSNVKRITNSEGDDVGPAWSPDGTKIAFEYLQDAWIMNSDGSNRTNIGGPGAKSLLSWSMDGSQLAFTMPQCPFGCSGNNNEIWVMQSDGSNQVNISNHPSHDSGPAWSPVAVPSSAPPPPTSPLTPTTTGTLAINGGALNTSSVDVTLVLSASNELATVREVSYSNDGITWTDWQEYACDDPVGWALPSGDGPKAVWGRVRDTVGHVLLVVSDTIDLDTRLPAEYGLTINEGAPFTNKLTVTLSIGAEPGTAQMQVSNDGGFSGAQWEPYATQRTWQITQYGNYVIPRVVYVRYKDCDGNVSSAYQDDIILDVTAPTGSVEAIAGTSGSSLSTKGERCAACPVSLSVTDNYSHTTYLPLMLRGFFCPPSGPFNATLHLLAEDDVSGVAEMLISNHESFGCASWEPYVTTREWYVPEGTTTVVYVKFRDNAGNVSEVVTDTVTLP